MGRGATRLARRRAIVGALKLGPLEEELALLVFIHSLEEGTLIALMVLAADVAVGDHGGQLGDLEISSGGVTVIGRWGCVNGGSSINRSKVRVKMVNNSVCRMATGVGGGPGTTNRIKRALP